MSLRAFCLEQSEGNENYWTSAGVNSLVEHSRKCSEFLFSPTPYDACTKWIFDHFLPWHVIFTDLYKTDLFKDWQSLFWLRQKTFNKLKIILQIIYNKYHSVLTSN